MKTSRPKSRLSSRRQESGISIIGAGRLGTALGLALHDAGYPIELVVTKRSASAHRAAKAIGANTQGVSAAQLERSDAGQTKRLIGSSVILIATPDDVISTVAEQLAAIFASTSASLEAKISRPRHTALHTSGALSSAVLRPLRSLGFATGSLHPLVSVSDPLSGTRSFTKSFFCVEGDIPAVRAATSMVRGLGAETFTIDPDSKALYHAAAVMASGNVIALFDIALDMLERCGLSRRLSHRVLLPLLESSVRNLEGTNSFSALTGPFARGDITTVQKHLTAMESRNLRPALAAYLALGARSVALARKRKPRPAGLDRLARLLSASAKESL